MWTFGCLCKEIKGLFKRWREYSTEILCWCFQKVYNLPERVIQMIWSVKYNTSDAELLGLLQTISICRSCLGCVLSYFEFNYMQMTLWMSLRGRGEGREKKGIKLQQYSVLRSFFPSYLWISSIRDLCVFRTQPIFQTSLFTEPE